MEIAFEPRIGMWDKWAQEAYSKIKSSKLLNHLRPICFDRDHDYSNDDDNELQLFHERNSWDRSTVEVKISEATFQNWLKDVTDPSTEGNNTRGFKNLIMFSSNDYLAIASHPSIKNMTAKAMLEHGMGAKGSAISVGYTNYHKKLESCLADSKKAEECLLCPSGYSANTALLAALGSVPSLLDDNEPIAIFSDALNHASIIDGTSIAKRMGGVQVFIYKHCDMSHLDSLLSSCTLKKKVLVTDSLFSMDGDFAPMHELVKLRKKYGFLFILDDAHGSLVCGKNGGGVSEEFKCEKDIDITIGTLTKAAICHGGFIACSKTWKQIIQAKGRNFIFSAALPIPFAAAAHAAFIVGKNEAWRRRAVRDRMRDFRELTGIPITSYIISLVIGTQEKAIEASKHMLNCGFHIAAMKPPVVAPNSCRLRVSLSAAHTRTDIERLVAALSGCIDFKAYKHVYQSNYGLINNNSRL